MRVITLENIAKFIENKHGRQIVSNLRLSKNDKDSIRVVVIYDIGTECPSLKLRENRVTPSELSTKAEGVHCILLETDLDEFDAEHPFIKSKEALSGTLMIDGEIPTEKELYDYFYIV